VTPDVDLAIVGSGFSGSILALIGCRLGLRVALLERGRHPRFAIGESASPLAGILVEGLAGRYDLPRLKPLAAYGPWQRELPHVVCGLKRGFTFFKHAAGERYRPGVRRARQLLVAASPSDELSDTHWLRADVDHFLVREAAAAGAEYLDEVTLEPPQWGASGVLLRGRRKRRTLSLRARLVVDASGPRGFLARALDIGDRGFAAYPATQALFSHFTDVARCDEMEEFEVRGADMSGRTEAPPYPADDAALHHVFDGGWMWVLRFRNGVTSAGVAVTAETAAALRLADGEPAWRRLLAQYPSVAAQFADARPIREFTWMPQLAYRAAAACGERWAMLPSAAAFIDPLFSTGIPLALLGIERIARILERHGGETQAASWSDYDAITLAEADHTARYIAGCYAAFPQFDAFTAYSMFYFAAASFSEMARRLAVEQRPRRFLCADQPDFHEATVRLSPAACAGTAGDAYAGEVARAVECLNIAGLADPGRRNWYPVDFADVIRGASKLGLTPADVREALTEIAASA
jgi:FADH2 O2-dependent halogenase